MVVRIIVVELHELDEGIWCHNILFSDREMYALWHYETKEEYCALHFDETLDRYTEDEIRNAAEEWAGGAVALPWSVQHFFQETAEYFRKKDRLHE